MYKKPFVSITVPIYNSEKQLTRCIESLISQTLKNIEIILVDDGSTDNSGIICDKYASTDARIKVYHQENAGSGAARQLGLEKSTGDYYTVCDSDDWVEPMMYEELYNKAKFENADIILSSHYVNYPNGKQTMIPSYNYFNQETYILDIMNNKASTNTWSKLFKLATIKRYNLIYEKGINLGEDALFLYKMLLNPMNIISVDKCYYHYHRNINSNSYTNNIWRIAQIAGWISYVYIR